MSETLRERDPGLCTRREPRYKTNHELLRCETTLSTCGLRHGTVIDLSSHGLRLLCEGTFEVGQPIFTELTTVRSHGIYQGAIRRVEPWVGGKSVLGCSLNDPIPAEVLEDLANEGAVNRRRDERQEIDQQAQISWPLLRGEVNAEIRDLSRGGSKVTATAEIPNDVRLRMRVTLDGEEVIAEGRPAWIRQTDDGCVAGIEFRGRDDGNNLAGALGLMEDSETDIAEAEEISPTRWNVSLLTCVTSIAVACTLLSVLF